jgi:hypothetical protein
LSGSIAFLIVCMSSTASGPSSFGSHFLKTGVSDMHCSRESTFFPVPTPCSPVHVPSMASARSTSRSLIRFASAISLGLLASNSTTRWKFPSPTCPSQCVSISTSLAAKRTDNWLAEASSLVAVSRRATTNEYHTAIMGLLRRSCFVSSMQSAYDMQHYSSLFSRYHESRTSLDIGTHTSVVMTSAPGRSVCACQ